MSKILLCAEIAVWPKLVIGQFPVDEHIISGSMPLVIRFNSPQHPSVMPYAFCDTSLTSHNHLLCNRVDFKFKFNNALRDCEKLFMACWPYRIHFI